MRSEKNNVFLCHGFIPEGSDKPESLVCEVIDRHEVETRHRSKHHNRSRSRSPQKCHNKIGRQIFSACINQGQVTSDVVQNLVNQANTFISQSGTNFANSLCTQQQCECQSQEKRCELFNWSFAVNKKGIECDPTCPSKQRYVVEAIVVSQCRCAKRECGLNEFEHPIILESTQCVPSQNVQGDNSQFESTCNQSVQSLLNTAQQLAETFCNKSLCGQTGNGSACRFNKLHHSEVECKKVKMPNGQTCCKCRIEIYSVECSCQ